MFLNGFRALSIISLLLVFSSNIVTLVNDVRAVNAFIAGHQTNTTATYIDYQYVPNSTIPNEPAGAAFGVINRLLIITQVLILVMSEFGWPAVFFDKYFPVLGKSFGVGALGIIQCLLGAAILSHHVDEFTLVSAFFLFSIGCLNMLVGLIWREKVKTKRSLTTWKEGTKDILPTRAVGSLKYSGDNEDGMDRSASVTSTSKAGYGFGRQGEKAAGLKGFMITRPAETLPRYAPKPSRASSPVFASSAIAV